ncbi:MAG TPA: hypothetical protein DCZ95_11495 [Verrucomicrobia bacterium]|nr:MAG: hypothetical protein A2X46_04105 [Lentisphaerae bacterium GWF2_57_35]HBA84708.1 hypothetical protein [Verrucomicrobiota bacterium]
MKRLPYSAFVFLSCCSLSSAVVHTNIYQYGLNGYTNVQDTIINHSPANYGISPTLNLLRSELSNPILRFDLSDIPSNSQIHCVELKLYNETDITPTLGRRVHLFAILNPWDEGNQNGSVIDQPGDYGATCSNAFEYYSGEGVNVPWTSNYMAQGFDFEAAIGGCTDVTNKGWYTWSLTELGRSWIRNEKPNYGFILRDASGYQSGNTDWRDFSSSQNANASLRPQLMVVYNPDVPYADAGPDQTDLHWFGTPIALDASGCHDRPGGNDETLQYRWTLTSAAYASTNRLRIIGTSKIVPFTPDKPGEWTFQLEVSNDIGETSSDTMALRVLSIPAAHPRIYLTTNKLAALRAQALPDNPRWTVLKNHAEASNGSALAKALYWQITGQAAYGQQAIAKLTNSLVQAKLNNYVNIVEGASDVAIVFDWCYDLMAQAERDAFIEYFNGWGDRPNKGNDGPCLGNYWPRYSCSYGMIGLASFDHNPRAQQWMDKFRHDRFRDVDLDLFSLIDDGGGWPEGSIYDGIANLWRLQIYDGWLTATGENLFESSSWCRDRLCYFLMHLWPGVVPSSGGTHSRPYPSFGDAERNRSTMINYERLMNLILLEQYPEAECADQMQSYLSDGPANLSQTFVCHWEYIWYHPEQASTPPTRTTHYAKDLGLVMARSGWPTGGADTDRSATYLLFQSGDWFAYHQHYEQNSITLRKYGDLLVDSGVYGGDGLSQHDVNYYIRTIAHNTLVVYNPSESFEDAREYAFSNDGGQRTLRPVSRSPWSLGYYNDNKKYYDMADMSAFEDHSDYTYMLGDATKAYNNPTYNQALDTIRTGNTAKVSRFHRECVYLRPTSTLGGSNSEEFVLLYDRVGVTATHFSGANTKLMFHVLNEPSIAGIGSNISDGETLYTNPPLMTAISETGKLFMSVLAPDRFNVRKVGGFGQKAFWVFGQSFTNGCSNDWEPTPYGEWRMELEPADDELDHNFLTVLYPTRTNTLAMPSLSRIVADNHMEGALIRDPTLNKLVLFSSKTNGAAPVGPINFSYAATGLASCLVLDLPTGATYRATAVRSGEDFAINLQPSVGSGHQVSSQGVLYLQPGDFEVLTELGVSPSTLAYEATYGGADPVSQVFVVTNFGETTTIGYTNEVAYEGGASGWLAVGPISGALAPKGSQIHTGRVSIAGLNAGVYKASNSVAYALAADGLPVVAVELTLHKGDQTIAFPDPGRQAVTNRLGLSAGASSGLPVSFSVLSGPGVLTGGANLSFTGAGMVTLTAEQAGNVNWNEAPSISHTFQVGDAWVFVNGIDGERIADGEAPSVAKGTDFGGIPMGLTSTNTLMLTNASLCAVTIQSITASGEGAESFALSCSAASVGPGAAAALSLVFEPALIGVCTASFSIAHSGTNSPYVLRVVGQGGEPIFYVSQSGSSIYPYSSWAKSSLTLQQAADAATPGGTLMISNGVYAGALNLNKELIWNPVGSVTVTSLLSGTGGLLKQGGSDLALAASNTFSGWMELTAGRVVLEDRGALSGVTNLTIRSGAALTNSAAADAASGPFIGAASGREVLVEGAEALWSGVGISVGDQGQANRLTIENGGRVVCRYGAVGNGTPARLNHLEIRGAGSLWYCQTELHVGLLGASNSLRATEGALVDGPSAYIGYFSDGNRVRVSDAGTVWRSRNNLQVGVNGRNNEFVLEKGALARGVNTYVGRGGGANRMFVSDAGSILTNGTSLYVGENSADNSLTISNSGTVYAPFACIGASPAALGNRIVVDQGSLHVAGDFDCRRGTNYLLGGLVTAGRLVLTNAEGGFVFGGGQLITRAALVDSGQPFEVGRGVTNALWTPMGTNHVLRGGARMNALSILAGTGAIHGVVSMQAGSRLSPGDTGSVGSLVLGGLSLSNGVEYLFEKAAGSADALIVTGRLEWGDSPLITVRLANLGGGDFAADNVLFTFEEAVGTPAWAIDYGNSGLTNKVVNLRGQQYVLEDGLTLTVTVSSAHGLAAPAPGSHERAYGSVLTNSVASPDEQGSTQFVCLGWTMNGNSPANGNASSFVMTLTNHAALSWLWTTNYRLEASAAAHGGVTPGSGWQAFGGSITLTAAPDAYYHFAQWSGDVEPSDLLSNPLLVAMDRPKNLTAEFAANTVTNGVPQWWLADYGLTNDFENDALADQDGDGLLTWAEYIAGSNPTNASSYPKIGRIMMSPAGAGIEISSVIGRLYGVDGALGPEAAWASLTNDMPGTGGPLLVPDATPDAQRIYRMRIRLP